MNLPLPNLDDQSYGDLVQEAIALIPLEYPEWTDHNPTDTGIILIELFAWLTEMILYQVNQIPDQNYASFLSLLKGEKWTLPNESAEEKQKKLQLEIRKTLLELRETYRAVTIEDYKKLILEEWQNSTEFTEKESIARVHCLPLRNRDQTNAKAHITLVVVNKNEQKTKEETNSYPNLFQFLDQRRLLTTRIHLVDPKYVPVNLKTTLVIEDGIKPEDVKNNAQEELKNYFHPLRSGKYWQGKGYPFGRNIYLSELYQLLDNLSGVDYVKELIINPEQKIEIIDLEKKSETEITEIKLDDDQLIEFQTATIKIEVKVGNESRQI
ncbi:MAG: baseplate J/gp47 family protein [Snowella sp.]|nr:baseplate J/gp47 family protein [Snowella sp.]